MSFDNPIGNSPSDLEYVKLQKDAQPVDNKRTRDRRFNVPDKLVRRPKNTPPPAPPVDPVEEEKRRSRALRFGITLPPPPPEVPSQVVQVTHNKPKGKKRNTGGIIAADGDGDVSITLFIVSLLVKGGQETSSRDSISIDWSWSH